LTGRQAASLVRKLALALSEAHQRGVIHRDLKPGNVMIDKRGEPMVMDFGLARRARGGDARLTQAGTLLGTPAYMPPEQIRGDLEATGPASDIYSLGVILYELLAGRPPFKGDPMAVLSQVLLDEPPPLTQFRSNLEPDLETICRKAMAKKPEDRFRAMAEFAGVLQGFLRNTMATTKQSRPAKASDETEAAQAKWKQVAAPATVPLAAGPSKNPIRKRLLWPWLAGGLAAAALVVGVLLLLPRDKEPVVNESEKERVPAAPPPDLLADPVIPKPAPAVVETVQRLFNGKNLSGWETAGVPPDQWRVEPDEILAVTNKPDSLPSRLLTERDYTDFLLTFEFQLAPGSAGSLVVRTFPGAPKSLTIPIQDDASPEFSKLKWTLRTGALSELALGRRAELELAPGWNLMKIELRGWSLRVEVNGKETVRTNLTEDNVVPYLDGMPNGSGRIGLCSRQGSIRFRKLELADFTTKDAKPPRSDQS
jgi:hypothetical protein